MVHGTSSRQDGFTLIELLVVIILVGILTAIALPSFLSQRSKAHDVSAKSDARGAELAIEQWKQDHDTYDATVADLQSVDQDLPSGPRLTVIGTGKTYTVTVRSASTSSADFSVARDAGDVISHSCAPTGQGGCPAGGSW
jgi:type IV pilus assembly protein PilA